jgi:hypothetical protein
MLLPRFAVSSMFPAEAAVLVQLNTVGGVLLILFGVVIALLALGAGQHDVCSGFLSGHDGTPLSVRSTAGGYPARSGLC